MKLQHTERFLLAFVVFAAALCGCTTQRRSNTAPGQVTVPLYVEGNRPYINVTFQRPDGSARSARFLVDTGGGGFIVTEPVARDLGLRWEKTTREGDQAYGHATNPPKAFVGEMPLELDPGRVVVAIGTDRVLSSAAVGHPEGVFPGHLLARYHVVFDYPKGTLTLARPRVLKPKGAGLPMPVFKESGFPRTEIEVDGVRYGLLLDTGASFTMVSEELLHSWGSKHPDWPRYPGAFGEAATLGGETLETMFIPGAQWGSNTLGEFGVTSQGKGVFENRMSEMMTSPIVGSLAGNVLKRFRVELDYANEKLYLSTP